MIRKSICICSFLIPAERPLSSSALPLKITVETFSKIKNLPEAVLAEQEYEKKAAEEKRESFQLFVAKLMAGNQKVRWNPESKQGVEP